jgi:hypothetical protein
MPHMTPASQSGKSGGFCFAGEHAPASANASAPETRSEDKGAQVIVAPAV